MSRGPENVVLAGRQLFQVIGAVRNEYFAKSPLPPQNFKRVLRDVCKTMRNEDHIVATSDAYFSRSNYPNWISTFKELIIASVHTDQSSWKLCIVVVFIECGAQYRGRPLFERCSIWRRNFRKNLRPSRSSTRVVTHTWYSYFFFSFSSSFVREKCEYERSSRRLSKQIYLKNTKKMWCREKTPLETRESLLFHERRGERENERKIYRRIHSHHHDTARYEYVRKWQYLN